LRDNSLQSSRAKQMIIKFLGTHSARSSDTQSVSFIVDDILAVDAGNIVSGLSFAEQGRIRAILLSHGHYDHIRDIPDFAFNNTDRTTRVFATPQTLDILSSHLMDGVIYPRFTEKFGYIDRPALELCPLELLTVRNIEGYEVMAVPVKHPIEAVGFEITSQKCKRIFYTGDTGPGLSSVWQHIRPAHLIIEVTLPNRFCKEAETCGHLCPEMLKKELLEFRKVRGYLPPTYLVHLNPKFEKDICEEAKMVSQELDIPIRALSEGESLSI
jgi:phosphoribosyl 1,2-cyclic phosphodiesterase